MASKAELMVLAVVYMPPQEPEPGWRIFRSVNRPRACGPSCIRQRPEDRDDGEIVAFVVARLDGAAIDVDSRHTVRARAIMPPGMLCRNHQ